MALVPIAEDLSRQVVTTQQLRKNFHEAYIVEASETNRPAPAAPPSAEPHRTLDNPTLNVLKSANYPFLLCEEAPPSYVPPPVPFDVEGEVELLKEKVLKVQAEFIEYERKVKHARRSGGSRTSSALPRDSTGPRRTSLTEKEVLDFFVNNAHFAELAWATSSLVWFYRWVLSHSISHLWNAKEALEYVLSEGGRELPSTSEEMDRALEEYPFTQAVSMLDNDRQSTIAQERRRLRSVSRTYRDRLPAIAVTAATSSYLSAEEKYMYQEFFNQSEHLLLLTNHALMLEHTSKARHSTGATALTQSRERSASLDPTTGALINGEGAMSVGVLSEDAVGALAAEQEVIQSLLDTIDERKRNHIVFSVDPDELERSRAAQVAVYGCVVSDMRLMGEQMSVAAEFMSKYEGWLQLYGVDGHDALMAQLSQLCGGTRWPVLPSYGGAAGQCHGHGHGHGAAEAEPFVPPTEDFERPRVSPSVDDGSRNRSPSHASSKLAPRTRPSAPQSAQKREPSASSAQASQPNASAPRQEPAPAQQAARPLTPKAPESESLEDDHGVVETPKQSGIRGATGDLPSPTFDDQGTASIFVHLLRFVDSWQQRNGSPTAASTNEVSLARAWQLTCLRYTVLRLVAKDWSSLSMKRRLNGLETALHSCLAESKAYHNLAPSASALVAILAQLFTLAQSPAPAGSTKPLQINMWVHSFCHYQDLREEVDYTLTPAEKERWGMLLDALWLQADYTNASNGGLLGERQTAGVHFLRLAAIHLPERTNQPLVLHYSTLDITGKPTRSYHTVVDCERNLGRRHGLLRAAVVALNELEGAGFLPCYACRLEEVKQVPLSKLLLLSDDRKVVVAVYPAPAVQLKRLEAHLGSKTAPAAAAVSTAPFDRYTKQPHFSTIGMLVADLFKYVGQAAAPALTDVVLAGETMQEQSQWEVSNHVLPRSFANGTTHPIPAALPVRGFGGANATGDGSSQTGNRNCASARKFVGPLLRQVDDMIAKLPADAMARSASASIS